MPQANDSTTGGYLLSQQSPAPLEGLQLSRFFQQWISGVSGLASDLVRPAWQPEPPNVPSEGQIWASFTFGDRESDVFPFVGHDPSGEGTDKMQRHERLSINVTFYDLGQSGLADEYAASFRDGVIIAQNRETLQRAGMGLVRSGSLRPIGSLLAGRWQYRVDVEVVVRRQIDRTYAVRSVETMNGLLITDGGLPAEPFSTILNDGD